MALGDFVKALFKFRDLYARRVTRLNLILGVYFSSHCAEIPLLF